MKYRTVGRILVALLLAFAVKCFPQNTTPVEFTGDPSRNTQIGSFTRNGTLYGSVQDIAVILNLRSSPHTEAQKLDLRVGAYTVKLTANNSFVVVTDKADNANLQQLPVNVLFAANSFFVPLGSFIPTLKTLLAREIAFTGTKIVVASAPPQPSSAFDLTGMVLEEKSNGFLIRLLCTKKLADYESWTKPIGNDTWLYITLANARADVNAIRKVQPAGLVRQILVFQSPTSVQLTVRLKGAITSSEMIPAEKGNDILVAIHTPTEEQVASRKEREYERTLQQQRDRWKLNVVVIDAGHGGDDPGTIGVTKTKEKDVTLGIVLKLGKFIEKNLPGVKVIYTRRTDTFIELYRRGQIANENGGKLFISVHCNAMPHKPNPTNGFEIYLLRPGKTENALRIAERENAVVKYERGYEKNYTKLTEENFILLSMAQSAYVKYSEKFASILQQEMSRQGEVSNNGVKQAGFYVLVGASMPNVLVEAGYLSNKHDEKLLKSAKGQEHIAQAIFNGVKRYKLEYEKYLREGIQADTEGTH